MADDNEFFEGPESSHKLGLAQSPGLVQTPESFVESVLPEKSVSPGDSDALVSRLQLVEEQPLDQRADSYVQFDNELRGVLEGSDNAGFRD